MDPKSTYKITIFNRNINYRKTSYIELPTNLNDSYDHIRSEYNAMRRKNREMSHGKIQEKYLTVTTPSKKPEFAEQYFDRVEKDFNKRFNDIGSGITSMGINERLEIFYDFYRCGQEQYYDYDDTAAKKRRSGYKDYICPTYLDFKNLDFDIGKKFGRVFFMSDWGHRLKPEVLTLLMELNANMMLSVDLIPFSSEEIRRILEDTEMSAESNVDRWSQRPGAEKRRYSVLPMSMRKDREIVDTHIYFLPDKDAVKVREPENLRWFTKEDIEASRDINPFHNAWPYSPTQPDVTGVGMPKGDDRDKVTDMAALAGASLDGKYVHQIGIDVLPQYRGRGLAPMLVSILKQRILEDGSLPFYGTAESHAISRMTAIRSGFLPAFAELFVGKKDSYDPDKQN